MSKIIHDEQLTYLKQFRKSQPALIESIEKFARENKVPILDWQAAEFLEQLIKISKPALVLEIGTAIAYSTIRIASCLPDGCEVHTIEKSKDNISVASANIASSGADHKIKLFEGDALEIMPGLNQIYDLIFLDADKEDYVELFNLSLGLLSEGGILFADNLLWQGYTAADHIPSNFLRSTENIREFNKLFMNCELLDSEILPVGDGIGLGIKKGKS